LPDEVRHVAESVHSATRASVHGPQRHEVGAARATARLREECDPVSIRGPGVAPGLRRGEYGIFITTSFYTRQAQEEVLEDAYPLRLFAGVDLIRFFRELKLIVGDHLRQDWVAAVLTH
jgi:hypothetical protein